jgi:multiple sugar transport system ATP-binding protein
MASVTLRGVCKAFGPVDVIRGVDLDIAEGEFIVFVGPSGCGKSTLLRMIAGLADLTSGELQIDGEAMNDVPASRRGIAIVFQSYALYPHMTAARNIGFALETAGIGRVGIRAKVDRVAAKLKIGHLLERKPRELSGGQRQRVAIGRALVREPKVFLFDEPLSNLDADLRTEMRGEIARLHQDLKTTMIYVTHDQVEAMTLADRIVILNEGRIEQIGAPGELYRHPANRFVAGFLGSPRMNFAPVETRRSGAHVALIGPGGWSAEIALPLDTVPKEIGVRPEAMEIAVNGEGAAGRLTRVEELGHERLLYIAFDGAPAGTTPTWVARLPIGSRLPNLGEAIHLRWPDQELHLFDAKGGRISGSGSK